MKKVFAVLFTVVALWSCQKDQEVVTKELESDSTTPKVYIANLIFNLDTVMAIELENTIGEITWERDYMNCFYHADLPDSVDWTNVGIIFSHPYYYCDTDGDVININTVECVVGTGFFMQYIEVKIYP